MNARWFIYVIAFLIGIFFLVTGFVRGDLPLVFFGFAIGIGLYFSRKYIQ